MHKERQNEKQKKKYTTQMPKQRKTRKGKDRKGKEKRREEKSKKTTGEKRRDKGEMTKSRKENISLCGYTELTYVLYSVMETNRS